jgi:hypothetical protein
MIIQGLDTSGTNRALLVDSAGKPILSDSAGAGSALADLKKALLSVGGDYLRVVLLSSIPAGTATIGGIHVMSAPTLKITGAEGNILDSIKAPYIESVSVPSLTAGTSDHNGAAVPANYYYIITSFVIRYTGTAAGVIVGARVVSNGASNVLYDATGLTSGLFVDRQGKWLMSAGDNIRVRVTGATAGDALYFTAMGYTIKTA